MKIIYINILFLLFLSHSYADSTVYYGLKKALKNPLSVERLVLIDYYSEVPEELKKFENLKELYLGDIIYSKTTVHNTKIDKSKLKHSKNFISYLPVWFKEMKKLEILSLSNNNFDTYPSILNEMTELKKVDITYNPLREIKCSSSSLKELSFSFDQEESNGIIVLPINLEFISIVNSRLVSTNLFLQLQSLKHLELIGVVLKETFNINDLSRSIEYLSLDGLEVNKFNVTDSYLLPQLKYLKCSGFLKDYNWICSTAINLKQLDLSFNNIDSIKSDFKLNNLKYIRFDHSKIKYVDSSFFQNNPNLDSASFYYNNIQSINIYNINNLQYLNLANNNIDKISISNFNQLKFLSYSGNVISSSNVPITDLFIIPHLELVLCENKFEKYKYKGSNYISVNYSQCN